MWQNNQQQQQQPPPGVHYYQPSKNSHLKPLILSKFSRQINFDFMIKIVKIISVKILFRVKPC
jgi:hypothetical protein